MFRPTSLFTVEIVHHVISCALVQQEYKYNGFTCVNGEILVENNLAYKFPLEMNYKSIFVLTNLGHRMAKTWVYM